MKFADHTNISVSVRCEPSSASASETAQPSLYELTLVVADGGRGMNAEECSHIFDPYFHTACKFGGGTGLGLSICKAFAHGMVAFFCLVPGAA